MPDIAIERKTGTVLSGVFDVQMLQAFVDSFSLPEFSDQFGTPDIDLLPYGTAELFRANARQKIADFSSPASREGVIADVAAVLVVGLASVVKAIAAGKDLAAVRAAVVPLQPFADAVLGTLATPADLADPAAAIAAGKTVFPYQVKGDAARVVGDMQRLANGVSQALSQARA